MNGKCIRGFVLALLFATGLPLCAQTVLSVSVEPGDQWLSSMRIVLVTVKKTPQVAVWVETEDGVFIDTLTVTGRTAKQQWRSAPDEGRPEALPVWSHAAAGGMTDLDAASSATPDDRIEGNRNLSTLVPGARYRIRAEVNHSFDYNEYWEKKAKKGSGRYSGVNGQPSVVYEGFLMNRVGEQAILVPVGQGSVDGSSGTVTQNLEGLTTALSIVDTIRVSVGTE